MGRSAASRWTQADRRRRGIGGELLGAADCETWRRGPIGQPTNALTSLAYVAGGGWLVARARRLPVESRRVVRVTAALSGVTGLGSLAYHGGAGRVGHVLHDGSVVALGTWLAVGVRRPALTGVADEVAVEVARRRRLALATFGMGLVAYQLGRTDAPTCEPTSRWQWHGLWHVAGAVATAVWADATSVLPHRDGSAADGPAADGPVR